MIEDEKIIEMFFGRSEQGIRELDIKYGKVCHKLSYNIVNSRQDAEECVNDAYLGAWNAIPPAKPNPLLTYICKIVRNISLKIYYRKEAAKRSSTYTIAMEEIEACIADPNTVEAEIEDGKKKIRQYENREKMLRQKLSREERRTRSHRLIVRGAVFESIVPEAKDMTDEEAHRAELALWGAASRYLHANLQSGVKSLPVAEWKKEYAALKAQRETEYTKLKEARTEVAELQNIRKCVDIAQRADQPEQSHTKRHDIDR